MKKQRNFILAIVSMLVVTIALLAFTTSSVSNDEIAEQSELVIEKGAKTDAHVTTSHQECGDGKCGDDKKEKKEDACGDDKEEKKKEKCGEGKCGEGDGESEEAAETEEE
ncbi:MAG: hypothetical protein GVY19_04545 [Bacteroidetes bacterium]|jgi:uncharacterized low-complexity protein|nr:hypothetical protein [Bacteroidota bacterium]